MSAIDLAYDNGPKFPGARDMIGPRVGWVIAKQLRNGDLEVNVEVRRADANSSYNVIVYCGPTHANAIAVLAFGSPVTTNASGAGSGSVLISAASIAAACGSGSHTGHVDLDSATTTRAATPLNFSSP